MIVRTWRSGFNPKKFLGRVSLGELIEESRHIARTQFPTLDHHASFAWARNSCGIPLNEHRRTRGRESHHVVPALNWRHRMRPPAASATAIESCVRRGDRTDGVNQVAPGADTSRSPHPSCLAPTRYSMASVSAYTPARDRKQQPYRWDGPALAQCRTDVEAPCEGAGWLALCDRACSSTSYDAKTLPGDRVSGST